MNNFQNKSRPTFAVFVAYLVLIVHTSYVLIHFVVSPSIRAIPVAIFSIWMVYAIIRRPFVTRHILVVMCLVFQMLLLGPPSEADFFFLGLPTRREISVLFAVVAVLAFLTWQLMFERKSQRFFAARVVPVMGENLVKPPRLSLLYVLNLFRLFILFPIALLFLFGSIIAYYYGESGYMLSMLILGGGVGIVAISWGPVLKNMRKLHTPITIEDCWLEAEHSTTNSKVIDFAFLFTGFYLPCIVLLIAVVWSLKLYMEWWLVGSLGLDESWKNINNYLSSISLFLPGVAALIWRDRWMAIRVHQVQAARDQLADHIFNRMTTSISRGEHPLSRLPLIPEKGRSISRGEHPLSRLPLIPEKGRTFFVYCRPFVVTDALRSAGVDLESRMADAVAKWAPLIALGLPGEARGAGRTATSDEEWEGFMKVAMTTASEIFLIPGDTYGIVEEIRFIVSNSLLDKVVFIRPPLRDRFNQDWWAKSCNVLRSFDIQTPTCTVPDEGCLFSVNPTGEIKMKVSFPATASVTELRMALEILWGIFFAPAPQGYLKSPILHQ